MYVLSTKRRKKLYMYTIAGPREVNYKKNLTAKSRCHGHLCVLIHKHINTHVCTHMLKRRQKNPARPDFLLYLQLFDEIFQVYIFTKRNHIFLQFYPQRSFNQIAPMRIKWQIHDFSL